MNAAVAQLLLRRIEANRRAVSRLPAPPPKPGTRITGAVASRRALVIATVKFGAGNWHYQPRASADFVLDDDRPDTARQLQLRIVGFLREHGITDVFARRPSTSQGMPAHAAAHKLMTLLELARSATVSMVHPNTIAAWKTREQPVLPRPDALRHSPALASRQAFEIYDRAIETAACAGMLGGHRHG